VLKNWLCDRFAFAALLGASTEAQPVFVILTSYLPVLTSFFGVLGEPSQTFSLTNDIGTLIVVLPPGDRSADPSADQPMATSALSMLLASFSAQSPAYTAQAFSNGKRSPVG